ncbi:MAG: YdcF family protein [Granulosicoccaceae bacterium]
MDLAQDWLTDPIALLFLLTLLFLIRGLIKRPSLVAFIRMCGWVAMVLLVSAPKAVNPLLAQLEDQRVYDPECQAASIVILGGGVSSAITNKGEIHGMSHATFSRATGGWRLAQQHSDVPIVIAGGAIRNVTEAEVMAEYLGALGVEPARLLLEGGSKNTAQNATAVAELLREKDLPEDIWLVTSASHMPRAAAAMLSQGMHVCAVPVDYQAIKVLPSIAWMPQTSALVKFDRWLHEMIAIALYKFKGYGA